MQLKIPRKIKIFMLKKKKIGIVTTWFERGAAYVSRQYHQLLAENNDVYVFARGGEEYGIGDPNWDGPHVTWARHSRITVPTAVYLDDLVRWIKTNRIDIVLFNEQHWWPAVLAAKKAGAVIGAYVDYYTHETIPFFHAYDFLLCNTKRHFSVFSNHPGAVYIPWGTDTELYSPRTSDLVTPQHLTFFHSAGVSPHRKGCDAVIEAFSRLSGPCSLVIHAQQDLKAFFPNLAEKIAALESSGRLICHEETITAPGLFHLGDVYVYPTRLEGIGLTIMEAASCGLPVITTDCQPMSEFIVENINGALVPVEHYEMRSDGYYWPQAFCDVGKLAEKMQACVDQRDSVPERKRQARVWAEANFDWESRKDAVRDAVTQAVKRELDPLLVEKILAFEGTRGGLTTPTAARFYERFRNWLYDHHPNAFDFSSRLFDAIKLARKNYLRRQT